MGVQVNGLYRNGDGSPRSVLSRQFISFSYGNINIEEFGLVVVFDGQGLDKEAYSPFQDITTEQEELNGQLFWRSKFNANKLSLTLATDGMTVEQLERFKFHFRPGYNRELILSEHHNRAILARVASAPRIKLTPFKAEQQIEIKEISYPIVTTIYKGEISLEFAMDDPFWYSKLSYINELSEENLKLVYEDNLPFLEDLKENCFLANNEVKGSPTSILYYCGTAPANPILSFDITVLKDENYKTLSFEENGVDDLNEPYIRIGEDKYLRFGLPSIFTSYNYVLNAIKNYGLGSSFLEVRKAIQAVAFDYYTRAYALQILEQFNKASGKIEDSSFQENFRNDFSNFFNENKPLHCNINNQTGMVTISCTVANSEEEITEKAGNMIKSNYLVIEPSEDKYQNISSNVNISNLTIDYKYMYL